MSINAADNSYTNRSPCYFCPKCNENKDICAPTCAKLLAYRNGEPWKKEEEDIMDDKLSELLKNEAKVEEKKVKKVKMVRGLSGSDYKKWRTGKILHPTLGKFSKKTHSASVGMPDTQKPKIIKTEPEQTPVDTCIVELDLTKYPEVLNMLIFASKNLHLPVEHVITGILAKAFFESRD